MTPEGLFASPGPFTTAELAAACRCSQRYVQEAIAAGSLHACRLGRLYRIPASAARQFAADLGVEAPDFSGEARDSTSEGLRRARVRDVRIAGGRGQGAS